MAILLFHKFVLVGLNFVQPDSESLSPMPFLLSEEEHLFSFSSGNYVTASNGLIMTGIVGPKQKWGEEEADVEGEHKER